MNHNTWYSAPLDIRCNGHGEKASDDMATVGPRAPSRRHRLLWNAVNDTRVVLVEFAGLKVCHNANGLKTRQV